MRIGELAERTGVKRHTIRYYEREGLLPKPARTEGGFRSYGPEAVDDLVFIKKAQTLGLRLDDIRDVLEIASGGRAPCEHVRRTVERRLDEVDDRLRKLRSLRGALQELLRRLDGLTAPVAGCRCAVIDSFEEPGRAGVGSGPASDDGD